MEERVKILEDVLDRLMNKLGRWDEVTYEDGATRLFGAEAKARAEVAVAEHNKKVEEINARLAEHEAIEAAGPPEDMFVLETWFFQKFWWGKDQEGRWWSKSGPRPRWHLVEDRAVPLDVKHDYDKALAEKVAAG